MFRLVGAWWRRAGPREVSGVSVIGHTAFGFSVVLCQFCAAPGTRGGPGSRGNGTTVPGSVTGYDGPLHRAGGWVRGRDGSLWWPDGRGGPAAAPGVTRQRDDGSGTTWT
ncbi:hypothetical protein CXF46_09155 [Corynebacterium bovis]|nr:hypothetical protein CXF46_09155 [Corynebacterium bovis]